MSSAFVTVMISIDEFYLFLFINCFILPLSRTRVSRGVTTSSPLTGSPRGAASHASTRDALTSPGPSSSRVPGTGPTSRLTAGHLLSEPPGAEWRAVVPQPASTPWTTSRVGCPSPPARPSPRLKEWPCRLIHTTGLIRHRMESNSVRPPWELSSQHRSRFL